MTVPAVRRPGVDTFLRFPQPAPLPLRIITLDCPICETPMPMAETRDRSAFVCSCGYEYQVIRMDTPPLTAF